MALKGTKRKAVAKSADKLFGRKAAASKKLEEKEPEIEEPADDEENEAEEQEEEVQETPEEELKREEAETASARKKELKSMYIDSLKKIATEYGLNATKREAMIESILKHEAQQRAVKREHDAKVREVVVKQKEHFEGLSTPDLKKLCDAAHIKGQIGKQERVQQLLNQWLAEDGVDMTLAKLAHDARREELDAMDKLSLRILCEGSGVDPFVKEVMADRVVKQEATMGCFKRPTLPSEPAEPEVVNAGAKKGDIIDNLIAGEAARKRQLDKQKQRGDELNQRVKDLNAMSLEQLQKELRKRKLEESGKKYALVERLSHVREQEDALAARTAELKGLNKDDLKALVASCGLAFSKSKDETVTAILDHEQRLREAVKEYEKKVQEVALKMKQELDAKSSHVLKDMCVSKGLKPGVSKDERIEKLVEEATTDGEVDAIIANMTREVRREVLQATDKAELTQLCEKGGLDALVKEVMVERVLQYESENGRIEPHAKKARK